MDGCKNSGFSLIEVNMAILIVAVGLLSLLTLFPLGLRESEMNGVDTHEAMFSDHILNGIEANASTIRDWSTWTNMSYIQGMDTFLVGTNCVIRGINELADFNWVGTPNGFVMSKTAVGDGIEFPENVSLDATPKYIRFELTIRESDGGRMKVVELRVRSGNYGSFAVNAQVYFTRVVFMGM